MSTKGFTLIEMLLVLSIIGMLTAIFPLIRHTSSIDLTYQCKEIKQRLMAMQQKAITEKRDVFVDFLGNELIMDDTIIPLHSSISCHGKQLHFTPTGSVSSAMSVTCSDGIRDMRIVIQLGTGRMHVES